MVLNWEWPNGDPPPLDDLLLLAEGENQDVVLSHASSDASVIASLARQVIQYHRTDPDARKMWDPDDPEPPATVSVAASQAAMHRRIKEYITEHSVSLIVHIS